MKVAGIQMVSTDDLNTNLSELDRLCQEASGQSPDVILLPENFARFGSEYFYSLAEQEARDNRILSHLTRIANKYQVAMIAGSFPGLSEEASDSDQRKVRSRMLFIHPDGKVIAQYDKVHLFDVSVKDAFGQYRESDHVEPGKEWVIVNYRGVRIGLSICYDLRFPLMFRAMAREGMDLLCVAAAFTKKTGLAHWKVLLQARAIENQCYVLAANQGGLHSRNRCTYGHSMLVDPWGQVLDEIDEGPGVVSGQLDIDQIQQLRSSMPIISHEKSDLPVRKVSASQ